MKLLKAIEYIEGEEYINLSLLEEIRSGIIEPLISKNCIPGRRIYIINPTQGIAGAKTNPINFWIDEVFVITDTLGGIYLERDLTKRQYSILFHHTFVEFLN